MEAFTAIALVTEDPVFTSAIPGQIRHLLGQSVQHYSQPDGFLHALVPHPPALAVLDARQWDSAALLALRHTHPLLALLVIGGEADTANLPLCVTLPRPLSMPARICRFASHCPARFPCLPSSVR